MGEKGEVGEVGEKGEVVEVVGEDMLACVLKMCKCTWIDLPRIPHRSTL